jgi:hypothetical protein
MFLRRIQMAVENRGGMRPTAPQNNPMSVSAVGGNGQSGNFVKQKLAKAQQLRVSGGGASGATKALNQQIRQGGNVRTTAPAVANMSRPRANMPLAIPLTEMTQNVEEPIQAGTPMPGGPGIEALNLPTQIQDDNKFNNSLQAYAQPLEYVASLPETSQETRDVIALLLRQTAQ